MKASKSLLLRKPAPTTVNEEPGDDLADVTPEPEFPEYLKINIFKFMVW